ARVVLRGVAMVGRGACESTGATHPSVPTSGIPHLSRPTTSGTSATPGSAVSSAPSVRTVATEASSTTAAPTTARPATTRAPTTQRSTTTRAPTTTSTEAPTTPPTGPDNCSTVPDKHGCLECSIVGRPLWRRRRRGRLVPDVYDLDGPPMPLPDDAGELSDQLRTEVAKIWMSTAQDEAAAVVAFEELADDLAAI